jgi:hypothetical protein
VSILFSDNFNIADTSSLGANYTEAQGDSAIVSNKIRIGSINGSVPGILLTTTSAHPDTTDVAVSATQAATGSDGGPFARCTDSDTTPTLYGVDSYPATIEIYRHDNNGVGTLLRTSANTQAANAIVRLEVTGTGATVTLKQFYNGVQKGADASDGSANRITTAGRTGIYNWVNGGTTARDYDDFLVEDFASGSFIRPPLSRPFPFKPGSPRYHQ